jgi:AbrB family looped-hinge helix DNA binding protein
LKSAGVLESRVSDRLFIWISRPEQRLSRTSISLLLKKVRSNYSVMKTESAHSTLTSKGQTTLPSRIRKALHLKAGDKILYEITGDTVVIRPHPGAMAVFGALKPSSDKSNIPFKDARIGARENRIKGKVTKGL